MEIPKKGSEPTNNKEGHKEKPGETKSVKRDVNGNVVVIPDEIDPEDAAIMNTPTPPLAATPKKDAWYTELPGADEIGKANEENVQKRGKTKNK